MGLHWTNGSPAEIARRLASVADQAPNVVHEVAQSEASRAETEMTDRAPWRDRTGHARGGLFGKAEATEGGARITLGGTMEYQPYLETGTKHTKAYPIIRPIQRETRVTAGEQFGKAVMELFR